MMTAKDVSSEKSVYKQYQFDIIIEKIKPVKRGDNEQK